MLKMFDYEQTLLKRDDMMCYYKTYDWATHFLALVKGES